MSRLPRHVYYRRRFTVTAALAVLVATPMVLVADRRDGAGAGAGVTASTSPTPDDTSAADPAANDSEDAPIVVPTLPERAGPVTRRAPTTAEPEPVVPHDASRFVAAEPLLVLDTRAGVGVDQPGDLPAAGLAAVHLADHDAVPTGELTAVVLALDAEASAGPGSVDVWAAGSPRPEAPTLVLAGPGDAATALTVVAAPPGGRLVVGTSAPMAVRVHVVGWFVPSPQGARAGRFVAADPVTLLDTRVEGARLTPGTARTIDVAGVAGTTDVGVAVVRLAASDASPPGEVLVGPTRPTADRAPAAPTALRLPPAGTTVTSLALVPLGPDGRIALTTTGESDLVLDLVGWFTADRAPESTEGLFVPVPAARVLDTRLFPTGRLEPGFRRDLRLGGAGGLPSFGLQAVLGRLSVVGSADAGSLMAWAGGQHAPSSPSLTFGAEDLDAAAPTFLPVGPSGSVSVRADAATDVLLDVVGYVVGRPRPADADVAPTPPDPTGADPLAGFDAVITGFLRQRGLPGASVAVARDGRIVYARAYGTADPATGAPVRVDTRFRLASVSKVVTAAAVLRLVADGRLGLDEPVWPRLDAVLPLPPGHDGRWEQVSVRHLLTHTSGLRRRPDVLFNQGAAPDGGPRSCLSGARWAVGNSLVGTPGRSFTYVNMNYCLLSLLLEVVTGQPYERAVEELALAPRRVRRMDLGHTTWREQGDAAHPTPSAGSPGNGWFMESLLGAGSLLGTPVDVVRLLDGLDPAKPGADLVDGDLARQLATPGAGSWGLGVRVFGPGTWGHTGSLAGARAMAVHQADGTTWAITVNGTFGNHGSVLFELMSRALSRVPAWPEWDLGPDLP